MREHERNALAAEEAPPALAHGGVLTPLARLVSQRHAWSAYCLSRALQPCAAKDRRLCWSSYSRELGENHRRSQQLAQCESKRSGTPPPC